MRRHPGHVPIVAQGRPDDVQRGETHDDERGTHELATPRGSMESRIDCPSDHRAVDVFADQWMTVVERERLLAPGGDVTVSPLVQVWYRSATST
jgi:hypothetical protein